ncbi:MFS transporter [Cognatishimia sp. WU-CL00825]|uniref:MFS transporter n=1 Tax=Cognatishimia sp. WU-CL00825 TaxID=3127658 RepID=UPI0031024CF9
MGQLISGSWALLLGIMLLMVGNGVQGTLLGIRGQIEGFSTYEMSFVMSAYFVGFLGGSKMAPEMIRRVGHVRVFAALGSFISAVLVLYPTVANPWVWVLARILIGFCFSGVYVTAESWLNNSVTNENRGKALSLYMFVQIVGIIAAQALLVVGDPSGYVLFVIPSILVSISFAPILLSVSPTPAFGSAKPMKMRDLWGVSNLGFVGIFLLGGMFSAQFGMSAVFGTEAGLSITQISLFVSAFYVGALVCQIPIGWLSDRMDRRQLILVVSALAVVGATVGAVMSDSFVALLVAAAIIGGTSNPLYSLLLAHTNDHVGQEDMAATSGALVFVNGLGAISGPVVTGWLMTTFGASAYFYVMVFLMVIMCLYTAHRMTKREAISVEESGGYAPISPTSSPVAVEFAQEYSQMSGNEDEDTANER